MFTVEKAAQVAAFVVARAGGSIDGLKLLNLICLADRESIARTGLPISFHVYVSTRHGPAPSAIRALINRKGRESDLHRWQQWISLQVEGNVCLRRDIDGPALNQFDDSEIEVLDHTWAVFGQFGEWDLIDNVLANCPEWKNPGYSAPRVLERDIFRSLGADPHAALTGEMAIASV